MIATAMNTHVPVLVIFRGGYGAVAVARTLGRLGVPAYLLAQEGMTTPVWSSRYWRKKIRWDFSKPESESLAFLLEVGRRRTVTLLYSAHDAFHNGALVLRDYLAERAARNWQHGELGGTGAPHERPAKGRPRTGGRTHGTRR